eukprot:9480018-Pyramimonas_sp.AAC.1
MPHVHIARTIQCETCSSWRWGMLGNCDDDDGGVSLGDGDDDDDDEEEEAWTLEARAGSPPLQTEAIIYLVEKFRRQKDLRHLANIARPKNH